LRVCLDARISSGVAGGVEQAIIGLASGLSALDDGDEEYFFLVTAGEERWITPFTGDAGLLRTAPYDGGLKRGALGVAPLRVAWRHLSPLLGSRTVSVPLSDGTVERAGIDVMHFTTQGGFRTEVPSLYQPWDLQHVHLPQFFTPRERLKREVQYAALCHQAELVVTASSWVRADVEREFDLPAEKTAVIPAAPALAAYPVPSTEELASIRDRLALPDAFLLYPAATFRHKNHLRLVEAVARLRGEGLRVEVVCSGIQTDDYKRVAAAVAKQRLDDQIRFVGFVSPLELQALYRLARGVVLPTLFEGFGLPLVEAFLAGAPVACSAVTSLPEQAGDAALLFDPTSVDEIARSMQRLWEDADLRRALAERGRERVATLTWDEIARTYRAHYRSIGGRKLSDEDRSLIEASTGHRR
jgi:glycosyltransferase involved in cell wall biosynthesis